MQFGRSKDDALVIFKHLKRGPPPARRAFLFYSREEGAENTSRKIMKIVSAEEMRAIDRATSERYGVPSLALMENAGAAVAEFVQTRYPAAKRIAVLCGKGNNGGDGFVAARRLHEAGKDVQVLLLADAGDPAGDAAVMFRKLPMPATRVRSREELKSGRIRPC